MVVFAFSGCLENVAQFGAIKGCMKNNSYLDSKQIMSTLNLENTLNLKNER